MIPVLFSRNILFAYSKQLARVLGDVKDPTGNTWTQSIDHLKGYYIVNTLNLGDSCGVCGDEHTCGV